MRRQDREGPTARRAQIALDTLYLLFFLGTCRISEAFVSSMKMHHPLTTAGTLWTQSVELIFAKLDGGDFPKSSSAIKPLYLGPEILINSGSVLLAGSGKKCLAFMGSTMRMTLSFCATVCTHASPAIRSCTSIAARVRERFNALSEHGFGWCSRRMRAYNRIRHKEGCGTSIFGVARIDM
jgi:hypothetical protein